MKYTICRFVYTAIIITMPIVHAAHEFHHPDELMQKVKTDKNPGKAIYEKFCANCHAPDPLIEVNAPKFRHSSDWQTRLKQNPKEILKHTMEGLNAMPSMGGCFECSEKLLQKTINYMLPTN